MESAHTMENSVIWRYMSFSRFKQLVEYKALYFSRIDTFSDFREGALPEKSVEKGFKDFRTQSNNDADAFGFTAIIAAFNGLESKNYYASCWNSNTIESNLMWRSYGTLNTHDRVDEQFKVCIKTTVGRVKAALQLAPDQGDLICDYVEYYDVNKDDPFEGCDGIDSQKRCYIKPKEYEEEREVRFSFRPIPRQPSGPTLADIQHGDTGVAVDIDLTNFIEALYIEAVPLDRVRANDVSRGRNYEDVRETTNEWHSEKARRKGIVESVFKEAGITVPDLVNSQIY